MGRSRALLVAFALVAAIVGLASLYKMLGHEAVYARLGRPASHSHSLVDQAAAR